MAVEIKFEANLAEVRKAIEQVVADARNKPITVPIQASGGAAGAGGGGAGGGAPTVEGVLGTRVREPMVMGQRLTTLPPHVQQQLAAMDPQTAAFLAQPPAPTVAEVRAARLQQREISRAGDLTARGFVASVRSEDASRAWAERELDARSRIPRVSAARRDYDYPVSPVYRPEDEEAGGPSIWSRRFNMLGAATAVATGVHALAAARENNIDMILAGSDQRAQLNAMMTGRKRLESNWIGDVVSTLQDPSGNLTANIRATEGRADIQDAKTRMMRENYEVTQRMSDRAEVGETKNPFERRLRQARAAHEEELRMIEERGREQARMDEKDIEGRKVQQSATLRERALAAYESGRAPRGDWWSSNRYEAAYGLIQREDEAEIASMRSDREINRNRQINPWRTLSNRGYRSDVGDITIGEAWRRSTLDMQLRGQTRVSRLMAANRPEEAEIEAARIENQQQLYEAMARHENPELMNRMVEEGSAREQAIKAAQSRRLTGDIADVRAGTAQTRALFGRDPLGAAVLGIEAERARALRDPRAVPGSFFAGAINEQAVSAISLARQQFQDDHFLRMMALAGQGRALSAALVGGRYGDVAAASIGGFESAALQVDELRRSGRDVGIGVRGGEGTRPSQLIWENEVKQQRLILRGFERRFQPSEVDPRYTDLAGRGAGNQEGQRTMSQILQVLQDINTKIGAPGGASPFGVR